MSFLRRLFGAKPESEFPFGIVVWPGGSQYDDSDQLAFVTVGGVRLPAKIYQAHQRDRQDWSSGIRLEDPTTGRWLRRTDEFPEDFRAAGARSIGVAGLTHHQPDVSRDDFAVGRIVRLVPEPANPADPRAVAVRSADGRYLAGYLPADELDEVWAARLASSVGLVTWENFTWRPRQRIGLILLIGPDVKLELVPANRQGAERARREALFAAGREAEDRHYEQERAEHEAHHQQVARWRAEGRCADCGGEIEPKGRYVRCASCRAARAAT